MKRRASTTKEQPLTATPRAFKAKFFARSCRKAGISDKELRSVISELTRGLGDSLGGNVWKKRLNNNMHRAIALTGPARFWLLVYLFAKQDRENIDDHELAAFKKLAKDVGRADDSQLAALVASGDYQEICK